MIAFALIGLAVHPFLFAAIVLMAILFGLSASELRSRRDGGVISGVATAVMSEARGVADGLTNVDAIEREEADPKDSAPTESDTSR